jgi:serine/threonine protein phosphatase PrpC
VICAFGVSDGGPVRSCNEDSFVADADLRLFAVADGMGGHKAGQVASQLAIDTITGFISRSGITNDVTWPYGIDDKLSFDGNRLRTAIFLANRKVFRAAESSDDYGGMGTTIVGMLVNGGNVSIASVGDSRAYVLTAGELQQLTRDDSWAATILAHDRRMRPEDIAKHPMRNVLTSVLGGRADVDVQVKELALSRGDVLLLSSDGVHGVLSHDVMRDALSNMSDAQHAAQALIDRALAAGSRDNVTAVVVRYEGDE